MESDGDDAELRVEDIGGAAADIIGDRRMWVGGGAGVPMRRDGGWWWSAAKPRRATVGHPSRNRVSL
jgi:hypothetical protein